MQHRIPYMNADTDPSDGAFAQERDAGRTKPLRLGTDRPTELAAAIDAAVAAR